MAKRLRLALTSVALLCLVVFVVFVINQTTQVVHLAGLVNPLLGQVVLWALLATYALLCAIPVVLFLRLPPPLVPPSEASGPGFDAHVASLTARLRSNPLLKGEPLDTLAAVEAAVEKLDAEADRMIKQAAAGVFLSTAVSQSGKLDGLLVLGAQSQIIWRVARLYWQRPAMREMVSLYANVAGTAFVASGLDDLDIAEQFGPITTRAVGGALGAVPFVGAATSAVTNSIVTGSANAFLTLRVGVITKQYCGALVAADRRKVRRRATREASVMLATLVAENAFRIVSPVLGALKDQAARATSATIGTVTGYGAAAWGVVTGTSQDVAMKVANEIRDACLAMCSSIQVESRSSETRTAAQTATGAVVRTGRMWLPWRKRP